MNLCCFERNSYIYFAKDRIFQGVVTKLFEKAETSPENTYAIICGPPVMYKFVVKELIRRNFEPWQIYLTLERRMRCGIGKCGHWNRL